MELIHLTEKERKNITIIWFYDFIIFFILYRTRRETNSSKACELSYSDMNKLVDLNSAKISIFFNKNSTFSILWLNSELTKKLWFTDYILDDDKSGPKTIYYTTYLIWDFVHPIIYTIVSIPCNLDYISLIEDWLEHIKHGCILITIQANQDERNTKTK